MPVPAPGGGGGWRHVPPNPQRGVSALKIFFAHYMYGNGLEEFGVFVVAWGVSMDRTTVMLTDQILK